MAIIKETKLINEILGEIYFDDGIDVSNNLIEKKTPFWLARPTGWSSDGVEILIAGNSFSPLSDSLNRATKTFKVLEKIEQEGRELIRPIIMKGPLPDRDVNHYDANLLWIDCQQVKTVVVFSWDGFTYIRWDATLDDEYKIIDLQQTYW